MILLPFTVFIIFNYCEATTYPAAPCIAELQEANQIQHPRNVEAHLSQHVQSSQATNSQSSMNLTTHMDELADPNGEHSTLITTTTTNNAIMSGVLSEASNSSTTVDNDRSLCSICLEEYVAYDKLKVLRICKHNFHRACVDKWIAIMKQCPICRVVVDKHDLPHGAIKENAERQIEFMDLVYLLI
uniref:RING-type domain-containing protein n=1 Tax=Globodera rostochiensis TaxID=31243 RepID=A0A914H612_GLORO